MNQTLRYNEVCYYCVLPRIRSDVHQYNTGCNPVVYAHTGPLRPFYYPLYSGTLCCVINNTTQPNRVGFYPVYLNTVPFALRNLQLSIFYKCAFNPNSYAHTLYCSYFCIIVLMQAFVQLLQLFILIIITIRVRPQPNRVGLYPVYFNTVPCALRNWQL